MVALLMFIAMVFYPLVCSFLLNHRFFERLEDEKIKKRISNLYQKIGTDNKWKLLYYPLFLWRRVVFVIIPTFLYLYPAFQVQFLLFMTSLYLIYFASQRPHKDRHRAQIETFNEVMIMITNYHMVCFSNFNPEMEAQFAMGYSFITCILLVVIVNILAMAKETISNIKASKLLKRRQTLVKDKLKESMVAKFSNLAMLQ